MQHLMHVLEVFSGLQGFVKRGHALHGTQDCRASWGPCAAWDSLTLQGFVGAMQCMGLTHTSSLNSRD